MNEENNLEERADEPDEIDRLIADNPEFFADLRDYQQVKVAYFMVKNGWTVKNLMWKKDDSQKQFFEN